MKFETVAKRALGWTSSNIFLLRFLMFAGLESMLHMTCVSNTKAEVTENLNKAKNLGIRNILGKETTACHLSRLPDLPTNRRKKTMKKIYCGIWPRRLNWGPEKPTRKKKMTYSLWRAALFGGQKSKIWHFQEIF